MEATVRVSSSESVNILIYNKKMMKSRGGRSLQAFMARGSRRLCGLLHRNYRIFTQAFPEEAIQYLLCGCGKGLGDRGCLDCLLCLVIVL